ncbi:hypothetical protein ACFQZ4_35145 [Catellatospora coxensis]|uniref:PIN domain-containing protein n=1 Tax=Catellatospora coxensis TaxID=310354 RepID=A0A8J3L4W3_9ACTN|nr:hypothetical protein [Catellatospora coxensis]GIG09159.1 hypothetical protein Cco03nite_58590 [Catellatospora coxensis]
MSIGLVLDPSALLLHLRLERVSIGELISEVIDADQLVGVPALAVVDVWPHLDRDDLVRVERMLSWDDSGIVVLPLTGDALLDLHRALPLVKGGHGVAHAVVEAHRYGCLLATDRPGDIGDAMDPDDLVELS